MGNINACLCWSGLPASSCCLAADKKWRPRRVATPLPTPPTGYAHPGCYCSADENCATKITREHLVPESILDAHEDGVSLTGPRFLGGETRLLPNSGHVSKILCESHNSNSSPIDQVSTKFHSTIRAFLAPEEHARRVRLLNGHDLERALIKLLCNQIASGQIDVEGKNIRDWKAPRLWLDYIWGRQKDLPSGWGLYFPNPRAVDLLMSQGTWSGPNKDIVANIEPHFVRETLEAAGAMIGVCSLPLLLGLHDKRAASETFSGAIYRPSSLVFHFGSSKRSETIREIRLYWDGPSSGKKVHIPRLLQITN